MTLAFIQGYEWVIVIAVIALMFGTKKIPDLARSLGKAKSEFHEGLSEAARERHSEAPGEETAKAAGTDAVDTP